LEAVESGQEDPAMIFRFTRSVVLESPFSRANSVFLIRQKEFFVNFVESLNLQV